MSFQEIKSGSREKNHIKNLENSKEKNIRRLLLKVGSGTGPVMFYPDSNLHKNDTDPKHGNKQKLKKPVSLRSSFLHVIDEHRVPGGPTRSTPLEAGSPRLSNSS